MAGIGRKVRASSIQNMSGVCFMFYNIGVVQCAWIIPTNLCKSQDVIGMCNSLT